ncbi:UDP-N-acetylmuramate:L-alanyl-gamma-D-glutamyl-meso-diaminopimelate ligase [Legionella geestiana]|uniref:UDP-N-acetylmuramate:L-alanyl-gamma-D-glutamyl- meso-diaminopimelate ligase n=1 Tax=Legionella geestiana TaxID=45065 RepID=UPI001092A93A|nr:UDP-N-acetylmuramate:L-alanyl-gamma-D-glutamyl-meso-diaminopimelate ligase [Legionella geestiana]QDQ39187.1 UDP-N-acetylmuramate:L-alanyl-gamma-D-glutamyl-meso-diaminopimelate ligase [Legionella geestiana]
MKQHLHLLGIGGTFMSGIALIARSLGYRVSGSDASCYPPVSTLLAEHGITWTEGYDDASDALAADLVIVGNAIKRGMPVMEAVLNAGKPYVSAPEWLFREVLCKRRVLAIAGTHGKTTTTSMAAHILEEAGLKPGFLIGGVASNFNTCAAVGEGEWFVIEADEYDTAFFDKRPKFMHYRPEIAVLNNLEFDHADIYANLDAIILQFHYLLRTIAAKGRVVRPRDDKALDQVMSQGVYCPVSNTGGEDESDWGARLLSADGSVFEVLHQGVQVARVSWSLIGQFNVDNALAAIAASVHAGVSPEAAARALSGFKPPKRRLEVRASVHGVTVYDDFAHHPTAIAKTLRALRQSGRHKRVLAVLEFASYTMRSGVHAARMQEALADAHGVFLLAPSDFSLSDDCLKGVFAASDTSALASAVVAAARADDAVLIMSNRGFDNLHQRIITGLEARFSQAIA